MRGKLFSSLIAATFMGLICIDIYATVRERNRSMCEEIELPSSKSAKVTNELARGHVSKIAYNFTRTMLPSNRDMVGSWIGDTWIPPSPWQLYSATDLARMWSSKKIWWIGDSLARRGAMTLYHILNTSDTAILKEDLDKFSILNVNKGLETDREQCPIFQRVKPSGPIVCRSMPGSTSSDRKSFMVSYLCTAAEIANFFLNEMNESHVPRTNIREFDVIVIGIGAHEKSKSNFVELYTLLARLCHKFTQVTGVPIVWRTSGYSIKKYEKPITTMNDAVMDTIDSFGAETNLTYIHWAGAVRERSFASDRIEGDSSSHYGVEPRLVLVQMLTNHLVDRGILQKTAPDLP
ncbi:hypothetical protein MHU86_25416 [Fragilaria crotonensis]|nr:hypothetical protein MHU86_25416 [Fragilaria crotonensis]